MHGLLDGRSPCKSSVAPDDGANAQLPIDLTDLTALFDFRQSGSPEGQKTNVLISEISETRANDATDAKVG